IWMDLYEDRKGYNNEYFGIFALKLFSLIRESGNKLIISDILIRELEMNYSIAEINGMLKPFENIIEKTIATIEQRKEAKGIARKRDLPPGDVLHAIIARDNKLKLITRDKHFKQLKDICNHYKPEELI
ncbi:PIN domain-containing protein, partial [Candidatus Woesearchaeota archaeon]|nr:PIN domain-containing protein [Candidatus Woesearchaeota archaeon]